MKHSNRDAHRKSKSTKRIRICLVETLSHSSHSHSRAYTRTRSSSLSPPFLAFIYRNLPAHFLCVSPEVIVGIVG